MRDQFLVVPDVDSGAASKWPEPSEIGLVAVVDLKGRHVVQRLVGQPGTVTL